MSDKGNLLQKLEDYKNDGYIDFDEIMTCLGNWMSTSDLREFVEFVEDEYVKY